jgi:hypothetical protein
MNRYVPRLSKLRPPYVNNSQTEVDILSVQTDGFANAHPGHRQETEKSRKRTGAQSLGGWEFLSLAKEPLDLGVGIDVRSLASITARENAYRRNLSPRVQALSQLAKRRTIPRRQAQVEGCASVGCLAQRSASSVVM